MDDITMAGWDSETLRRFFLHAFHSITNIDAFSAYCGCCDWDMVPLWISTKEDFSTCIQLRTSMPFRHIAGAVTGTWSHY